MRKWLAINLLLLLMASCAATGNKPTSTNPTAPDTSNEAFSTAAVTKIHQTLQPIEPTGAVASSQASTLSSPPTVQVTEQTMIISSPSFKDGQPIPVKFSCLGENVSPALAWSGLPSGTKSLALITEDPDAPSGTFTHWVIYNMPATLTGLPEKVTPTPVVNGIGTQGNTSFNRTGYGGPCPPAGKPHRYFFKLFALDLDPQLPAGLTSAALQRSMQGHILAQAQWMGTFQR